MTGCDPLHPKDNLYIAVGRLKETGQWSLPVVDGGREVGTVTARAILSRLTMRHGFLTVPCLEVGEVMEAAVGRKVQP